jgi:hypothetical protein
LGKTVEKIRISNPAINTVTVRRPTPFHSFNKIPHTLLKITFSDINMLHEKASMTGEPVKKLFPIPNPKN